MKLYTLKFSPRDGTICTYYFGTQAEANKSRRESIGLYGKENTGLVLPIDVPTNKAALVAWLNDTTNQRSEP